MRAANSAAVPQASAPQPFAGAAGAVTPNFFGLLVINGNSPTASFGGLRIPTISWTDIEPTRGVFNWSALDARVNQALSNNQKVFYSTDAVPPWAAKDPSSCTDQCTSGVANLADWDAFVTALVQRYKGRIEAYELWNEPDQGFTGPMSDFLPLAQHFHDIVRANDPAALIVAPGPVTVSWLDTYWAAGGVRDVDVVAFHGWPSQPVPENLVAENIAPLNAILAKYGLSSKTVWDGSAGWGSPTALTDLQAQAAFVARYYLLHWSNGVSRFYWYSWDDDGDAPTGQGWGALANWQTGAPYPAGIAYQQLYNWMVGTTMSTPCSAAGDGTWTCVLTKPGGYQALAIWNPSTSSAYTPAANYTQYRDLAGNVTPLSGPVTIGSQPILLEGTGTAPPPPPPTLQITTSSLPAGQVGSVYSATLAATGGTAPYTWSIGAGSLPAGLSLDAGTGAITGTPTDAAQSTFTVSVADSSATQQSATVQLSITISATAPPPPTLQISTAGLPAGQVGTAYSASLAATGGTTPYSWSISAGSLPAGLSLNPASGAISGTPTAAATSTFTVSVADSSTPQQTAARSLSIAIAAAPPTLSITTASLPAGQLGTAYSATLAATGGTTPYSWSIGAGSLPAGLTLNAASGAISGTPTAAATSTFTVSVADSSATQQSATRSLSIAVAPAPLQITPTSLPNGQVQTAYNVTLAGTGGTTPYAWTAFGTLPAGLSLNSSTGAISGTPTTAATSSFTIQLSDSGGQSTTPVSFSITIAAATTNTVFNHVVIVVEENTNYSDVIGSSLMPYLNSLAAQNGLATQFYANTHPSIGNYLWMVTGRQLTNDDSLDPSSFPVSVDNVVRQLLAAGKTWKSYSEDLPSVGYIGGDSGNYAVRHNPLPYLTDVQNVAAQRQNLVPFSQFATDLANNVLPNYSFVTPNLCDDAHDCGIDVADRWLQTNISPLVNDPNFQTDGLLLIVFDESGGDNTHGGGRVALVVVSPQAKQHFQSTTLYQWQSFERLTLEALGVMSWPGAGATAPSMSEFFTIPLK